MKLPKEQREAYLTKRGVACPYCGNTDIEGAVTESDHDGSYRQRITCHVCGKQWVDVYTLTEIEEEDGAGRRGETNDAGKHRVADDLAQEYPHSSPRPKERRHDFA